MILAGDIGGTKTHLALFEVQNGKPMMVAQGRFASVDYPGLEPIIDRFYPEKRDRLSGACFGIAGPVVEGKVKTPNLPWFIDSSTLAAKLGIDRIWLLNDLEATGYGILTLPESEIFVLNHGVAAKHENLGLIAAGTGLGESILYWDGTRHRVLASEGGHGDFAPRNDLEIALLKFLIDRFGHVSYERVVSGPGLVNIYDFFKNTGRCQEPEWLRETMAAGEPAAVISEIGLAGKAEICVKALDLFVSVYGAEAGNLALRAKALGGIFIGGGIGPKILNKLQDGSFLAAFTDKGRYREFAESIPVNVVLNDEAALLGAAVFAACQGAP
jgi:glucokinase